MGPDRVAHRTSFSRGGLAVGGAVGHEVARAVSLTLAIGIGFLAFATGPVSAQQGEPTDLPVPKDGGVLFLTSDRFDTALDPLCGGVPQRYAMTTNASTVLGGSAAASAPATPIYRCVTRFEYIAQQEFSLGAKAHVHLTISCDPAAVYAGLPGRGAIRLLLSNNPDARSTDSPAAPDPNLASADPGPLCTPEPTVVDVDVPAQNLTFNPGSTLVLLLYVSYLEPNESLPAVRIHVGGADPSRLQAPGIPAAGAKDAGFEDDRPVRYWTSDIYPDVSGQQGCGSYFLSPTEVPPPDGSIDTVPRGCHTAFVADIASPREVWGRVTARFWYWCDGAVVGSRDSLSLEVAMNDANHPIATRTGTGPVTEPEACPQEPTEVILETVVDPPVLFPLGAKLVVLISGTFLVVPAGATMQLAVGESYPSSVRLHGLQATSAVIVDKPALVNSTMTDLPIPTVTEGPRELSQSVKAAPASLLPTFGALGVAWSIRKSCKKIR